MKKLLLLSALTVLSYSIFAQQLYVDAFSGYNVTAYQDAAIYSEGTSFIPLGGRIGGGLEHVQLGVEYQQQIKNPIFSFPIDPQNPSTDPLFEDEFVSRYYGAFLRGNLSSLPAYRFGVTLLAGVGKYETEMTRTDLMNGATSKFEYEPTTGYNFRIGISSPIYTILHWEFGYQINIVDRPELISTGAPTLAAYQAIHHSFQAGLSLNFVFGNVAKKCRRVIDTGSRGRGWR